ncbi:hypothetical protein [Sorangium sp. So ce861]|uniref:hypothetical protein n=1 Tax=Sorangium sp. So ce861 TaxID=3133323 RepID=UPI003F62CA88
MDDEKPLSTLDCSTEQPHPMWARAKAAAGRLRRLGAAALALLVAAAVWLSCLHLFFQAEPGEHRASGALSPRGQALLAYQLSLWDGGGAAQDAMLTRMRATNAEWDFMGRTFLVLGFANAALRDPGAESRHLAVIDRIVDETLALERERGMLHFLMPYATRRPFCSSPRAASSWTARSRSCWSRAARISRPSSTRASPRCAPAWSGAPWGRRSGWSRTRCS